MLLGGVCFVLGLWWVWHYGFEAYALIFVLVGLDFLFDWSLQLRARRLYRTDDAILFRPHSATVDDTGIITRTDTYEGKRTWGGYTSYLESKSSLILGSGNTMFSVYPKRAFTDPSHLQAFRELATTKIAAGIGRGVPQAPDSPAG